MWLQLYSIMKQARLYSKPGPALVSDYDSCDVMARVTPPQPKFMLVSVVVGAETASFE